MNRYGVAITAGAITTIVALAGCGTSAHSSANNASGSKVITIWDQQQSAKNIADGYQKVISAFEAAHPGVTVKLQTFPYQQYQDKLLVAMKGGTGPDIMTLDEVWNPEFAAAGLIDPLNSYVSKSSSITPGAFFPGAWQTTQYQGKTYGIPLNFDVWEEMYYNADLFRQAGLDPNKPPTTWSQWNADAAKLTSPPNHFGIGLIGCKNEAASVMVDSLLFSNGGKVAQGTKAVIDSPADVTAYNEYKTLLKYAPNGTANACEQDVDNEFTAGKVAMILDGSWQQDTMNAAAKFDWRIALPPAPDGKSFVGALGGWNLAINKNTKNANLAFQFIEALSQPQNETAVNSLIPALKSAGEAFVRANRKQPDVILAALNSGEPRPISPVYPQVSQVQQDALQSIIGGANVNSTLASAQQQMDSVLSGQ